MDHENTFSFNFFFEKVFFKTPAMIMNMLYNKTTDTFTGHCICFEFDLHGNRVDVMFIESLPKGLD